MLIYDYILQCLDEYVLCTPHQMYVQRLQLKPDRQAASVSYDQTWGNYQLVNYFLPISHYNWQLRIIGH